MRSFVAFSLLAFGAVAACTGDAAKPSVTSSAPLEGSLPCDVDAVLASRCRTCHGDPPGYGAPMPLVTFGDLHAPARNTPGKKVYEVVSTRIHSDLSPMPQPPNARLSAADMATLDPWIAAGAPEGSAGCGDAGTSPPVVEPLACDPDQRIRPASKFSVTSDPDLYVCYGFDTNAAEKRHIIAGAPRIDNTKVVHHVLLYQADEAVSPTPQRCGSGGGKNWRLVTGWAPGGKNFQMPPEAGFAEEAGTTHWAVQIHYNNAQNIADQVDETGYDLCTTDQLRANDADILATGTLAIDIPERSTHTATCEVTFPANYGKINVISAWAHMHRLGRAEYAKRIRNGEETTVLDAPNYDFNVGAGSAAVNVDIGPGDVIRTMCRWQNPGSERVTFGEGTSDEMCFAFMTYYPKITAPKFRWAAPASPLVSHCTTATE